MADRTQARLVAGAGSIITLFCLMLVVQANQTVPATGLIGHWPLDAVANPQPDVSPNALNAVPTGTPTAVAGLFGGATATTGALNMTGTQYLTVAQTAGNAAAMDIGTNSFTVACWIKPSSTAVMRLINKWDNAKGFHFDLNAGAGGGNVVGNLRIRTKDSAAVDKDYFVAGGIVSGQWQHVAAVVDRGTNTATLYVNGKVKGTPLTPLNFTGNLTNTATLGIGNLPVSVGANVAGAMDELVLYKTALTAAEIAGLAQIPQGLTATINQYNQVTLNWTASSGAQNYAILRSPTAAGAPALVTYVTAPATSYVDTVAPGTYYYTIQANLTKGSGYTSPASNQATGTSLQPNVSALPNANLQTNENGASTQFTITYNVVAPTGGSVLTVSSTDAGEGIPSTSYTGVAGSYTTTATGFQVTVPAGTKPTIVVTVKGQPDNQVDGDIPYKVTVTAGGMTPAIPDIQLTNVDTNKPGFTFSRLGGLSTTESGGKDNLTVSMNTVPFGTVHMVLSSSNPGEATVSPAFIDFTSLNWNAPNLITVTGVDDGIIDLAQNFVITAQVTVASSDTPYLGVAPTNITGVNVDNEVIPPAQSAWGGSGNGGGCGLTGLDAVLLLGLLAAVRRRRV